MKIYGKTIPEIFQMLPWPYKAVVVLGTAFFLFAVPYSLHFFLTLGVVTEKVEPIAFPGLGGNVRGMLDPAVASDGKQAIMAHTTTTAVDFGSGPQFSAEVNLERASAPCRAWMTISGVGLRARDDDQVPDPIDPRKSLPRGIWRAETPAIVYDPDDPGRQWKLYGYRYFWNGDEQTARIYGAIVQATAPKPEGPWTDENWLFTARPDLPPEPYSGFPRYHLSTLSPELADVIFYARPSVVYFRKTLFMTLSAFVMGSRTPDRVILLSSTDHGNSWAYRGTVLRGADAPKMGSYEHVTGASLLLYENKLYLAAVLGNKTADGLGTFLIPFANEITAQLARDEKTGAPVIANHFPRNSLQPSALGGGFAAYTDLCRTGMMIGEYSDIRQSFQIFKTYKKPLDK
ncbi:MAG TPA: hypothetical protein VEF76_12455 [Patescibacteria group bacterium]|nr:hypothetical protein [Patescibacteria group bacterium]